MLGSISNASKEAITKIQVASRRPEKVVGVACETETPAWLTMNGCRWKVLSAAGKFENVSLGSTPKWQMEGLRVRVITVRHHHNPNPRHAQHRRSGRRREKDNREIIHCTERLR